MARESATWNEESVIACQFSFQCPRLWSRLELTEKEGVRYCSKCEKDVHLVQTEEDFKDHASQGHCVAVRVHQANDPEGKRKEGFMVGNAEAPYNAHQLKGQPPQEPK